MRATPSLSISLNGSTRLQGLIKQGPLVAVDEMQFYAPLVRSQGHLTHIAEPLVIEDPEDFHQEIASRTLQCKHAYEVCNEHTDFVVPVLYLSHWIPLGLTVSDQDAIMRIPQDLMHQISHLVIQECGMNEVRFESFIMPTASTGCLLKP